MNETLEAIVRRLAAESELLQAVAAVRTDGVRTGADLERNVVRRQVRVELPLVRMSHVRVADIDTPETHHPRIGREPRGEEATRLARYYLQGRSVWLEGHTQDRYGRRLARVRLSDGRDYAEIVRHSGLDKRSSNLTPGTDWMRAGAHKRVSQRVHRAWLPGH